MRVRIPRVRVEKFLDCSVQFPVLLPDIYDRCCFTASIVNSPPPPNWRGLRARLRILAQRGSGQQ